MPKTSNSSQGPINEETTKKIKELLQKNPMGLSVTQVATNLNLGRNTVAKYLDLLTTAGILDRREVGKAKIYNVSHRIPTSAVMELSTDSIFIVNSEKKLIQLNSAFEELTKCDKTELINKKFSDIDSVNKCISKLEAHISKAIFGKEWKGIIECHKDNELKYFKSRTIPTTLETGEKAATIFMENITEEIKIKQAIKSKLEFEEVIMSLLKEVMSSPVTKLDKVVNEGLKKVGEFSKVDRTYIFSFDKEKNDSSNIYEWCSKGIAPQIKSLKKHTQ
jgi:PAS domain S-box-containing protein